MTMKEEFVTLTTGIVDVCEGVENAYLFIFMNKYTEGKEGVWVSISPDELANDTKIHCCGRTIRRIIKRLIDKGFLNERKVREGSTKVHPYDNRLEYSVNYDKFNEALENAGYKGWYR